MNLFRDTDKLTMDNIGLKPNRKWKTSFISPMGCNIMVVHYLCNKKTKKISIYLNEVPLEISVDGLKCTKCPVDPVVQYLRELLDTNN